MAPSPEERRERPDGPVWSSEDYAGLRDVLDAWSQHAPLAEGGSQATADALRRAVEAEDMDIFFEMVDRAASELAYQGTPLEELLRQLARASSAVVETVARSFRGDAPRLIRALRAFSQLKDGLAVRAGEAYARERVAVAQEEQRKVIRELSTPVVEVWQGILVMPLVGVLDSVRARQMMEQLLERIKALGSRVVIVDVTGVPTVDTEVANHFLRTMQAARLVGAATILVGISPAMAQTLVRLEATLPGLETYADLRSGLEAALERLGYRVVSAYPKVGRGGHRHG